MLGGSIAAVARWRLPPAPYGEDAKLGLSRLRRRGKMGARRASRFTPRQRCSLGVGTPQPRTKRVTSRYYNLWVVTKARHKSFIHNNLRRLGEWCNGSTSDSGSLSQGSNPCSPVQLRIQFLFPALLQYKDLRQADMSPFFVPSLISGSIWDHGWVCVEVASLVLGRPRPLP